MERHVTGMNRTPVTSAWGSSEMGRNVFWMSHYIFGNYDGLTLNERIYYALRTIQPIYYPILSIIAVPVNIVTIIILSQGKCGLSKGVTHYLVAMAAANLLVSFLDLILAQIPIAFPEHFLFLKFVPLCNVHAVPLYAATDCSVWSTVAFTFDRCVAICCQKLKAKYCTERTAAVVLGTVTVLSCFKDTFWYFIFTGEYVLGNVPWFCWPRAGVQESAVWMTIEFIYYYLNPLAPFFLVLLLNAVTIRHVLVASRARRRLQASSSRKSPKDPEMEKRRKSLILLLIVSGNFIPLWALFTLNFIWYRLWHLGSVSVFPPDFVPELSFMLQLLSCCTNTALYAMTQTKFREQLKEMVNYPVTLVVKHTQCRKQLQNS